MAHLVMPALIAAGAVALLVATSVSDAFGGGNTVGGLGPATLPRALMWIVLALCLLDLVPGAAKVRAARRRGERLVRGDAATRLRRAGGIGLVVLSAVVFTWLAVELDLVLAVAALMLGWMLLLGVRRPLTLAVATVSTEVLVLLIVTITHAPVSRLIL